VVKSIMNIRASIFLCGVAGIVVLTASAEAKCAVQRYRVEVEVRSSRTGEPVPDAQLAVFANGSETEMTSGAVPSHTSTGPDGKLARTYVFNTYSGTGIRHVDRCGAKLQSIEVVLMHPGYRARRVVLKKVGTSSHSAGDAATVVVPLLAMEPIPVMPLQ
jgi:hypothetical protein